MDSSRQAEGREWSGVEGTGVEGRAGQGARLLRWTFTGRDFIPLNTPVERAAAYFLLGQELLKLVELCSALAFILQVRLSSVS